MHASHLFHCVQLKPLLIFAVNFTGCNFTANTNPSAAGALQVRDNARVLISSTVFFNNTAVKGKLFEDAGTGGAVVVTYNATREYHELLYINMFFRDDKGGGAPAGHTHSSQGYPGPKVKPHTNGRRHTALLQEGIQCPDQTRMGIEPMHPLPELHCND